jgi:hypothetical protein
MVMQNWPMTEGDDTQLILEFLQHRIVEEIHFGPDCKKMSFSTFKKYLEIFRLILTQPVFAEGNPKKLKTRKIDITYLSPEKLKMVEEYVEEVE